MTLPGAFGLAALVALLASGGYWLAARGDQPATFREAMALVLFGYLREFAAIAAVVLGLVYAVVLGLDRAQVSLDHPAIDAFLHYALALRDWLDALDKALVYLAGGLLLVVAWALVVRHSRKVAPPPVLPAAEMARHIRRATPWLGRSLAALFVLGMLATAESDFARRADEIAVKAVRQKAVGDREKLGLAQAERKPGVAVETVREDRSSASTEKARESCREDEDDQVCIALVRAAGRAGSAFERGFADDLFGPPRRGPPGSASPVAPAPPEQARAAVERAATRKAILDRYAASAPATANIASVPQPHVPQGKLAITVGRDPSVTEIRKDDKGPNDLAASARELAARSADSTKPATPLGQRFERDLLTVVSTMDRKAKEAFIASFPENPVRPPTPPRQVVDLDAHKLFAGELFKFVVDFGLGVAGIDDKWLNVEIGKGAVQAASERAADAYLPVATRALANLRQRWSSGERAGAQQVASEAAAAASARIILHDERRVAANLAAALPGNVDLEKHANDLPPALEHTRAETGPLVAHLRTLQARATAAGLSGAGFAKAASVYEDSLPHRSVSADRTNQGELEGPVQKDAMRRSVEARSGVANSFEKSHGHDAVGGVVIGRQPTTSAPLDVIGLNWSAGEDGFDLSVEVRDRGTVSLGRFPAETLATALAYAADARVTAVTILNVEELDIQRVHLHPALVDTGMGCRFIAADRWLFDWMKSEPALSALYRDESAAYDAGLVALKMARFAHVGLHFRYLREWASQTEVAEVLGGLSGIGRPDEHVTGVPANVDTVAGAIWPAKPDSGRSSVLNSAKECVRETSRATADACYARSADEAVARTLGIGIGKPKITQEEAVDRLRSAIGRLSFELPESGQVSGVREMEYALDPSLSALQAPKVNSLSLSFMLLRNFDQTRFQVSPLQYSDKVQKQVEGIAQRNIAQDPDVQRTIRDLQHFVVAQRLFRAALAGRLGAAFPLSRLVELGDAVNRPLTEAPFATARWIDNHGPGYRDTVAAGLKTIPTSNPHHEGAHSCAAAIQRAGAGWLSSQDVDKACKFGPSPAEVKLACSDRDQVQRCNEAAAAFQASGLLDRAKTRAAFLARNPTEDACVSLKVVRSQP